MNAILNQQEGPLGKIAPLFKVIDKIKFTDDEMSAIVVTQQGDLVTYSRPTDQPDFGKISVSLEDTEAAGVVSTLETWPKFRPIDNVWVTGVLSQLKGDGLKLVK